MTGELCELFPDRQTGVREILSHLATELDADLRVYMGLRGFADTATAMAEPASVGSMNFLASAALVARSLPDALLIDMGSTTTDIIRQYVAGGATTSMLHTRPRPAWQQRPPRPDAARHHPGHPRAVPRGRRRHRRDQHVHGTAIAQADYGLEALVLRAQRRGGAASRVRPWTSGTRRTPDQPRYVAGAIGPTNRTLSLSPDVNDPAFRAVTLRRRCARPTRRRSSGLLDGGVDLLLIETIFDTLNAKAALVAVRRGVRAARRRDPGDDLGHDHRSQRPDAVGPDRRGVLDLDRARAAVQRRPQLRARRRGHAPVPAGPVARSPTCFVSCYPNAGLPNAFGGYDETPEQMARRARRASPRAGLLNIIGGCCGTTPDHIRAMVAARARASTPRAVPTRHRPRYSRFSGPRAAGDPPGEQLPDGRRAHQRHRLGEVHAR